MDAFCFSCTMLVLCGVRHEFRLISAARNLSGSTPQCRKDSLELDARPTVAVVWHLPASPLAGF
jgi:hypothetical protein